MRTVELAKVAAAAEALRLRRIARRQGLRVAFGAGAAVFAVAVLVGVHVVIWHLLIPMLSPTQASLAVVVLDLLITAVFAVLAMRDAPDSIELEAKQLRHQALIEMRRSVTVMSMAAQIAGSALRTGVRTGARRNAASVVAEMASRLLGR